MSFTFSLAWWMAPAALWFLVWTVFCDWMVWTGNRRFEDVQFALGVWFIVALLPSVFMFATGVIARAA